MAGVGQLYRSMLRCVRQGAQKRCVVGDTLYGIVSGLLACLDGQGRQGAAYAGTVDAPRVFLRRPCWPPFGRVCARTGSRKRREDLALSLC